MSAFFIPFLPIFSVVDFHVVVIFEILLFVALSFVAMTFQFLSRGFFRFGGGGVVLDFVDRREPCFFVIHIKSRYALCRHAENVCR